MAFSSTARTLAAAILGLGGVLTMIVGLELPIVRDLAGTRAVGMRVFIWEGNYQALSAAIAIGVVTTLALTAGALWSVRFRRWAALSSLVTAALGVVAFFFVSYTLEGRIHATYSEFVDLTTTVYPAARGGLTRPVFFSGVLAHLIGLALIKGPVRWIRAEPHRPKSA